MKTPVYERRQRARLAPIMLTLGVAIIAIVGLVMQSAIWVVAIPLAIVAYLFSSMTIAIVEDELRWHFGPGFWRKSVLLSEIDTIHPVRNLWLYGWGIRRTPHGWLYNIEGLDALEIGLRGGRRFRLGTDDPKGLAEALDRAAAASGFTPPSAS